MEFLSASYSNLADSNCFTVVRVSSIVLLINVDRLAQKKVRAETSFSPFLIVAFNEMAFFFKSSAIFTLELFIWFKMGRKSFISSEELDLIVVCVGLVVVVDDERLLLRLEKLAMIVGFLLLLDCLLFMVELFDVAEKLVRHLTDISFINPCNCRCVLTS